LIQNIWVLYLILRAKVISSTEVAPTKTG